MVCVYTLSSLTPAESPRTNSRRLRPSKSNSNSSSSPDTFVPLTTTSGAPVSETFFSSLPNSFSNTLNGFGASRTASDCFNPDPFGLRDEASSEVVESLECTEREDDRGLKPGLCAADAGPKWLVVLRGAGEYALFVVGAGVTEGVTAGVECPDNLSSHIFSFVPGILFQ